MCVDFAAIRSFSKASVELKFKMFLNKGMIHSNLKTFSVRLTFQFNSFYLLQYFTDVDKRVF